MKSSADLGECYPPRPLAWVDNTLLDLQNSLYPTQPHSIIANYLANYYWMRLSRIWRILQVDNTPLYGYIGMCSPKGKGFSAVLVINRVSMFALWSWIHSFLEEATSSLCPPPSISRKGKGKVKSAYEPSGPLGRSLSRFL